MGSQESKRIENTGEVINEIITTPNENTDLKSLKIMVFIITIILIFNMFWKLHSSYRNSLKKKYKSSATLSEI